MSAKEGFFSFGFRVFLFIVLGVVISDAVLYYVTDHTLGSSYYEALVILTAAKQTTFALSITLNAIIHLTVIAGIFIASLVLSNRIAGPMYRFERVAESVKEGDLGVNVTLRHGDFMKSQAADFSRVLSDMRGRIASVSEDMDAMAERAAELDAAISAGDEKRKAELLQGMRSGIGSMKETLSFFKT